MVVARGLVTPDELEEALAEQRDTSAKLGPVLVGRGLVNEVDLVRVLAEHFGLGFVDLDQNEIDPSAVQVISQSFTRHHQLLPIGWDGEDLVVAMANPTNVFTLDDARSISGRDVKALMAEANQLARAIDRMWDASSTSEAILGMDPVRPQPAEADDPVRSATAADAPVIQFVSQMIARAVKARASDIHLDPRDGDMQVRFRIDGVLHDVMKVPRRAQARVVSRVKISAEIDIAERRIPQDGRASMTVAGRDVSLRVVTLPTAYGEALVIRVLEDTEAVPSLGQLGMRGESLKMFEESFRRPWGAVLVTGPTGSGKSTTLYAALSALNEPSRNIVTVEDPVEYRLSGVKQMQVNRKAGLTFPRALRSILRADPDVVMVGEVRDTETAQIAVEAALTGHLVLTSMHSNDAASTPARLVEMGIEPFMLTSSINCIVAQRLARRLCERCRQPYDVTADRRSGSALPPWLLEREGATFYRSAGCQACANTGYRGRIAIHEVMVMTEEVAQLVAARAMPGEFAGLAVEQGMVTMRDDGLRKAAAGETSVDEVFRAVG